MPYLKSDMVYKDYKWTADADKDNPYYTKGTDYSELNRTEGYEMLYFINHVAEKHFINPPHGTIYTKMEKMIREVVPSSTRTHKKIADWIIANWSKY